VQKGGNICNEGAENGEDSAWLIDDSHKSGKQGSRRCRRRNGQHW